MICINANVGLTILEVNFHSSCWLRQEFESKLNKITCSKLDFD